MRQNNRGQVLVIFALALFALMGLAALGIDVGFMYSVRHELQRSADAGALAGASAFFDGDWASDPIRAEATARAKTYSSKDAVATKPLDPAAEVSVSFPSQDRVQVTTRRTVNLFFARVFGKPTQNISAVATAEAKSVDQKLPCIKPWGIPYPWDDKNGDTLYTPRETVYNICPQGTWVPGTDDRVPGDNSKCVGTQLVLKIGTPAGKKNQPDIPSLQQESGHFFALDFGSGAKTYKEMIKGDCPHEVLLSAGDEIALEPGDMVGPTVQAVTTDFDSLINQDKGSHWNTDKNLPESDQYPIDNTSSWMKSPRVVRIPMYDPRDPLQTGKTDMTVATFAGFWVEDCQKHGDQGTVIGRFLPANTFGQTRGPSPGPSPGTALKTLRLVE